MTDDQDHALLINGVVWATYPSKATAEARAAVLRAEGKRATVGRITPPNSADMNNEETLIDLATTLLSHEGDDYEEMLIDIVTTLRKYAHVLGIDWVKVIDLAELHFEDEQSA